MQKTRARRLISALAILMGDGRKEKISFPVCPLECSSVRRYLPRVPERFKAGSLGECGLTLKRQEGTRLGRIIHSVTFSFNLGFQP